MTPFVLGLLHHGLNRFVLGHRCAVGDRLATRADDFVYHRLGCADRATLSVDIAPQVIHQHFSAALGQRQRVLFAQAATCTCDNGDTSLKFDTHLHSSI